MLLIFSVIMHPKCSHCQKDWRQEGWDLRWLFLCVPPIYLVVRCFKISNTITFKVQVLHDAFFKFQTKPKLTGQGDLYYEGKEFEVCSETLSFSIVEPSGFVRPAGNVKRNQTMPGLQPYVQPFDRVHRSQRGQQ
jgi:hypothetical protein